jgi:hypothetical protein
MVYKFYNDSADVLQGAPVKLVTFWCVQVNIQQGRTTGWNFDLRQPFFDCNFRRVNFSSRPNHFIWDLERFSKRLGNPSLRPI